MWEIFEEETEVNLTLPEHNDESDGPEEMSGEIDEESVLVSEEEQEIEKAQTGPFDDEQRPAE